MDTKHPHALMPDEEIIELYWQRNESAIKETDVKYGKYLYAIAYNLLCDRLDSEECLNDTYLGTWNRIPPARPNFFSAFLSRIARNIAVDRIRKNTADKRIPESMLIPLDELRECFIDDISEADQNAVNALAEILNGYLKHLSERQRTVFVCRYYYADSVSLIAKMLQVSERTVFRELEEIRNGLKKELTERGYRYE
ncbi:MAG: RNA polymerase sigma factor [Clostridia bacterium]|nr:RNA polymerase sigma factor [Clostridia bacterium]